MCVCNEMSTAVVNRGAEWGVAVSQLCTAGMQDGTDGGGMRPVVAADLCSSLGCLLLRPSHFSSDSLKHIHHCHYSAMHRHMMWRAVRFHRQVV